MQQNHTTVATRVYAGEGMYIDQDDCEYKGGKDPMRTKTKVESAAGGGGGADWCWWQ